MLAGAGAWQRLPHLDGCISMASVPVPGTLYQLYCQLKRHALSRSALFFTMVSQG